MEPGLKASISTLLKEEARGEFWYSAVSYEELKHKKTSKSSGLADYRRSGRHTLARKKPAKCVI
jgi:hypothetical protein